MSRPGDRLRAFASSWCCPDTMTRLIEPLIADLRVEHADAVRRGQHWKSRRVQIGAWIAFFNVLVVCTETHLTTAERRTTDDQKSLVRAAVIQL